MGFLSDKSCKARTSLGGVLWGMFFLICFGLGYPTLNRYDPSKTAGTADAENYFQSVTNQGSAEDHMHHRILVPYLARPIYALAKGRVGSWNAVAFSMLVVNSAFCAASVVVLFFLGISIGLSAGNALLASCAYLLNFGVANDQLAGLVDSVEAFLMTVLLLVLWHHAWNVLPVLGMVGGLAKETFIPIAFLFAVGWVWREKNKPWIQILAMALVGLSMVGVISLVRTHHWGSPVESAVETQAPFQWMNFVHPFTSSPLWLTFLWPLPFAWLGTYILPKEARYACALASLGVYGMVVWADAGSNISRPLFNVLGPCLCIAFVAGIAKTLYGPNGTTSPA